MDSSPNRVASEGLTPVTEIDLRALSEVKTEIDTFLTVYLTTNIKDFRPFVDGRLKAIKKALPDDLKDSFAQTLDLIEPAVASAAAKGERGRMIFASASASAQNGFLHVYRVGVELEPLVVWDSSPFLLPLARLRKDYEDYGLLLIDSQEYRLFLVRSRVAVEKEKRSIDLMNKHKKGGWSQMRFNRLRRGAIKSFLTEAVEDLNSLDIQEIKGLVVAGPGEAKGQLVEMLPASWKGKVLGVLDISMQTPSGDLVKLGNVVANSERSREKELAEKLKDAVLKGRPAAYGIAEVGEALKQGRVNHLILSNSFALPQMICKKCHFHGEGETCPTCGGQMQALSLEELYQQAERTGAEVVLVEDDAFLESIGGIGAILRY
jgi:peptide chain release factor subunit 1